MSKKINISEWIEESKSNPDKHITRQVIEILINAIGQTKYLKGNMFLKGGTLMALAHKSQRMTGDVDFSWLEPFDKDVFRDKDLIIRDSLDSSLNKTARTLGYLDLRCKVQKIKQKPNWDRTGGTRFPALEITIGYAKRGSNQEKSLDSGNCTQILRIDISFNEDIIDSQELILDDGQTTINAYTPIEIISEKFRALIQQIHRNRNRRQDIYDINLLLRHFDFNKNEKESILHNMIVKSKSRDITPQIDSLSDYRVKEASQKEWDTMRLELGDLPDFNVCYEEVKTFYESLPWDVN